MADITITAATLIGTDFGAPIAAAAAVAVGDVVYKDAASKANLADADAVLDLAHEVVGVALTAALTANQPVVPARKGKLSGLSGLTKGTVYVLSKTPGKICPQADITTGGEIVQIGRAESATVIALDIKRTRITV